MYAIMKTGGKQYKVSEGDVIKVEKLDANIDEIVEIDNVLALSDGTSLTVGNPVVDGAKVQLKVIEHAKARKIIVFKYKPKKNYRRKTGHRQPFTKVLIEKIVN